MPETEVSICNKALNSLGANPIISLTDKTPEAALCVSHYAACRDAVLEDAPWSFATRALILASPVTDLSGGLPMAAFNLIGYSRAFEVPPNMLRVLSVNNNERKWEIQGKLILVDHERIVVKGVIRVEDTSYFSARFVQCLVYYLAANVAMPITESPARMETMMSRYAYEIKKAMANDGRQGMNERRTTRLRR